MAKRRKHDNGENMLIAGIDQDQAEADASYARLLPEERGELAHWMTGKNGDVRNAPDWVLNHICYYASLQFMETGLRWAQRESA